MPWYEFHEFSELSSRTFRSLEEQLYIKKAQLKRQPTQHAAILVPGQAVEMIKASTIKEHRLPRERGKNLNKPALKNLDGTRVREKPITN